MKNNNASINIDQKSIDIVYTWVDGNDQNWLKRKKQALKTYKGDLLKNSISKARFQNHDELKYSLRSVDLYMPWVNKIFIITDQQKPEWINPKNKKIIFVDHKEIFPKDVRVPVFNSSLIELFLDRINGLSNKFIYFNDDSIINRPLKKTDFFSKDGKPIIFGFFREYSRSESNISINDFNDDVATKLFKFFNSRTKVKYNFLTNTEDLHKFENPDVSEIITYEHAPRAMDKSEFKSIFEKYYPYLKNTYINQFRARTDVFFYGIYAFNTIQEKKSMISKTDCVFEYGMGSKNYSQNLHEIIELFSNQYKFISISQGESFDNNYINACMTLLKIKFNKRSVFEKKITNHASFDKLEFTSLTKLFEDLVKQLKHESIKNKDLLIQLKDEGIKNKDLVKQLKDEGIKNKDLIAQINHFYIENVSLKNQLNEIQNSFFWKFYYLYNNIKNFFPRMINKIKTLKLLIKIKKLDESKTIIYSPSVGWNIPLFQRPQHMAINLVKNGFNFIYGTEDKMHDKIDNYSEIEPNLIITPKWRKIIEFTKNTWVLISSTQMFDDFDYLLKLKNQGHKIIYDYVDKIDYEISGINTQMIFERHQKILKNPEVVDLVLVISEQLKNEVEKYFSLDKILYFSNGVDTKHFDSDKKIIKPKDLSIVLKKKKPIVGYYGAFADWLDYELIEYVCSNRSKYNFVFIGSDYDGKNLQKLPNNLKNVFIFSEKKYSNLPNYSKFFNTAIIPFKDGDISKSASPLKFFEFLSMKIPTVITNDLLECKKYKLAFVAKNKKEFCSLLDKAITAKDDLVFQNKMRKVAERNSWHEKTNLLSKIIYEKNN